MPTLQVLKREADPTAELISKMGTDIANTMNNKRNADIAIMQLKLQAKNSEDEATKMKYQRAADIFKTAMDLKNSGASGDQILRVLNNMYGEDTFTGLAIGGQTLQSVVSKEVGDLPDSGERASREALARKNMAEAQQIEALNSRFFGIGNAQLAQPQQDQNAAMSLIGGGEGDVSGQPIQQPTRASVMQNSGQDMGMMGGFTPTQFQVGGMTFENLPLKIEQEKLKSQASKAGAESVPIATADQKNALTGALQQQSNVTYLQDLANQINKPPKGLIAGFVQSSRSTLSGGKFSPELLEYTKSLPAVSVSWYKNVIGDNKISDIDAEKRALNFFWRPDKGETEKIKENRFDFINKSIEARIQLLREGSYVVDADGQLITPMNKIQERVEKIKRAEKSIEKEMETPRGRAMKGLPQINESSGLENYTTEQLEQMLQGAL